MDHEMLRWYTIINKSVPYINKKNHSPFSFSSFSFPLFPFPSFSFCYSLPHFSFFPWHHFPPSPSHSILQNIYPCKAILRNSLKAKLHNILIMLMASFLIPGTVVELVTARISPCTGRESMQRIVFLSPPGVSWLTSTAWRNLGTNDYFFKNIYTSKRKLPLRSGTLFIN